MRDPDSLAEVEELEGTFEEFAYVAVETWVEREGESSLPSFPPPKSLSELGVKRKSGEELARLYPRLTARVRGIRKFEGHPL